MFGFIPTPYWIIAPGSAIDLSEAVAVEGHAPPSDRFYLTDVSVQRASALLLAAALLPGNRLVRQDDVLPQDLSGPSYAKRLADAMDDSQTAAAIVAERAAGLRVPNPQPRVVVIGLVPASPASDVLRVGDEIVSVNGRTVRGLQQVVANIRAAPPASRVRMQVRRGREQVRLTIPLVRRGGHTRIGVALRERLARPALPVAVRYSVGDVAGGSGGLMFALQIYSALRGTRTHAAIAVAGTGTISTDGTVGAIEGTAQKLIVAKRVGARVFFVPRPNFPEIAAEHQVRVVPVATFRDAVAALAS